jgi:hypothetical protein
VPRHSECARCAEKRAAPTFGPPLASNASLKKRKFYVRLGSLTGPPEGESSPVR